MKTIAAFVLVNAAIFAVNAVGAAVAQGIGLIVYELGLEASKLAWAIAGILSAGSAISVAARLAGIGRGA